MLSFDMTALLHTLEPLPERGQAAFAAAVAHRLLGGYALYAARSKRGDVNVIEPILDRAWATLLGAPWSQHEIREALATCLASIPSDDESPWIDENAYADDAASATAYLLRSLLGGGPQEAAWAAQRAFNSLDFFVRKRLGVSDAAALEHPIVQRELGRQRDELEQLTREMEELTDVISSLKARAELSRSNWPET